jgi:hypothetical protein
MYFFGENLLESEVKEALFPKDRMDLQRIHSSAIGKFVGRRWQKL